MKFILEALDRLAGWWMDRRLDMEAKNLPDEFVGKLKRAEIGENGLYMDVISPAIAYFADQASRMLNAAQVDNYLQFDMTPRIDRKLKPVRVTVQWANGLSPAEKVEQLEKQLAIYKSLKENLELHTRAANDTVEEMGTWNYLWKRAAKKFWTELRKDCLPRLLQALDLAEYWQKRCDVAERERDRLRIEKNILFGIPKEIDIPPEPGSYKKAKGILPVSENTEKPEETIRRMRVQVNVSSTDGRRGCGACLALDGVFIALEPAKDIRTHSMLLTCPRCGWTPDDKDLSE